MNTKENLFSQFGLCLNNEGYPVSIEIGKVYRVIQDDEAVSHGYIRVIDESNDGDVGVYVSDCGSSTGG